MLREHLALRGFKSASLDASFEAFLLDRQASLCTSKMLTHYRYTMGSSAAWLKEHSVSDGASITAHHMRAYLVSSQERKLKDTTQHALARGIKAWLNWLVKEGDLTASPIGNATMQAGRPHHRSDHTRGNPAIAGPLRPPHHHLRTQLCYDLGR